VEELAVRAEELGFSSFWVYDTPMVHGDPFTAMALCAKATSRIIVLRPVVDPPTEMAEIASRHRDQGVPQVARATWGTP
jgi:5,10-methylenetetrahydromethanopterin reductase